MMTEEVRLLVEDVLVRTNSTVLGANQEFEVEGDCMRVALLESCL
jgi:hypothetical protein